MFKKSIVCFCLLFISVGVFSTPTFAEVKVGFVEIDRIIAESVTAKRAPEMLRKEFAEREAKLIAQERAFKEAFDKFQNDLPMLSEVQRRTRELALSRQEEALQLEMRSFQQDLNTRKDTELQKILALTNQVIRQIAEKEDFDFILQEATYIKPSLDITNQVIEALDTTFQTGSK